MQRARQYKLRQPLTFHAVSQMIALDFMKLPWMRTLDGSARPPA